MNLKEQLKNKSTDASKLQSNAKFGKANPWLRAYSSQIARRISTVLYDENLSQLELARKINVSPQQISKILKGQENLSLKTIYKLSEALNVQLITFPEYRLNANSNTVFSVETKSISQEARIIKNAYKAQLSTGRYVVSITSPQHAKTD